MLDIYKVSIRLAAQVAPSVQRIAERDRDLSRQLARALASVTLNISEGSGEAGGNRRRRYRTALGSARESFAALELAAALGYTGAIEASVVGRFDHIIGVLMKVTR